jgi:hypothetical protein
MAVTVVTVGTDFLIHITGMTIPAGDILMLSCQAKIRLVVIELGFPPALGGVAVLALFTELSLVLVGKLVAGITIGFQFLVIRIFVLGMTLIAGHNFVLARQLEVSVLIMIKLLR